MPNYTSNYKLTKPLANELYNIDIQNNNMDTVDTNLKKTSDVANEANSRSKTNESNLEALKTFQEDPFEETGKVVQVDLFQDAPLNVISHIEPVQEGSGDPSPDNIRPITGHAEDVLTRCGKNLCLPQWTVGEIDANTGQNSSVATYVRTGYVKVKPGNIYALSRDITTGYVKIRGYAADKSYIGYGDVILTLISGGSTANTGNPMREGDASCVIQLKDNVHYLRFVDTSTSDIEAQSLQLELGSTATAYEPYNGETFTADFGQTVYGGTYDWNTGMLTIDHNVYILDGTEEVVREARENSHRWLIKMPNPIKSANSEEGICSHFVYDYNPIGNNEVDNMVTVYENSGNVYLRYDALTTEEEMKAFLAGQLSAGTPVQIDYKVANPITIQLTPHELSALAGCNTLYSNCGDTTVSGRKDIIWLTHNLVENVNNIVNVIYPVGSIYMSVNPTSPTTLFGGTWEQIKDTFLLSAGDTYAPGSTGGEAEHTLTVSEMPSHSHNIRTQGTETEQNAITYTSQKSRLAGYGTLIQNSGGGQPHNNMPPYLTVYMWKRIA